MKFARKETKGTEHTLWFQFSTKYCGYDVVSINALHYEHHNVIIWFCDCKPQSLLKPVNFVDPQMWYGAVFFSGGGSLLSFTVLCSCTRIWWYTFPPILHNYMDGWMDRTWYIHEIIQVGLQWSQAWLDHVCIACVCWSGEDIRLFYLKGKGRSLFLRLGSFDCAVGPCDHNPKNLGQHF